MKCNIPKYSSWFMGLYFDSPTPCKACQNNKVCGFNKCKAGCKKFIPKGCK